MILSARYGVVASSLPLGPSYFLTQFYRSNNARTIARIQELASGQIAVFTNDQYLAFLDSSGDYSSSVEASNTGANDFIEGASNDLVFCGSRNSAGFNSSHYASFAYPAQTLNSAVYSNTGSFSYRIFYDGNFYFTAERYSNEAYVRRLTTSLSAPSGTYLLRGARYNQNGYTYDIYVDSTDCYTSGMEQSGAGIAFVMRANNTLGTGAGSYRTYTTTNTSYFLRLKEAKDDSAYLVAGGMFQPGAGYSGGVAKIDKSTLATSWARYIRATGSLNNTVYVYSVDTDSDGNVYALATHDVTSPYIAIYKFSSTGTLLLQRRFISNQAGWNVDLNTPDMYLDDNDNIVVSYSIYQTSTGYRRQHVARIPNDGSITGTYTVGGISIIIENFTPTVTSITLTQASVTTFYTTTDSRTSFTPSMPTRTGITQATIDL